MNFIDHIVIACADLTQAARFCAAQFGVSPQPGGKHALMSTHNLLLAIKTAEHPFAYLEFIAIDGEAPAVQHARWFGLDDPGLQTRIAQEPELVSWMLKTDDIQTAIAGLAEHGFHTGPAIAASRGDLSWLITVPADGKPVAGGVIPGLLQWGEAHPSQRLEPRGVTLKAVRAAQSTAAQAALTQLFPLSQAPRGLEVEFETPKGLLRLNSKA
jgi:hypothetical protein